jgi:hypothetical protein
MNTLSWIIAVLGLVATIIGSLLAIITYINPVHRLKCYLKKPDNWRRNILGGTQADWQYKNHPEFKIEIDDESKEWDITESWMTNYPDPSKSTKTVRLKVNGHVLIVEEFIQMDGCRYFVPLPKRKLNNDSENEYKYWYTLIQVKIGKIVGNYYNDETIDKFIKRHKLEIKRGAEE